MVIDTKKTFVAYRCPACGRGVVSAVGVFSLGADLLKLKCTCGQSELTVTESSDGKVRLVVPCMICPKPHNYTVSRSLFFGKELFVLQCPYSDVNICFLGDRDAVSTELEHTMLELLDRVDAESLKKIGDRNDNQPFTDPQIYEMVMFVIHDLDAEGKIFCNCPDGKGDYSVNMLDDGIEIRCKNCGASRIVPTDSHLSAHAFLTCDKLVLE